MTRINRSSFTLLKNQLTECKQSITFHDIYINVLCNILTKFIGTSTHTYQERLQNCQTLCVFFSCLQLINDRGAALHNIPIAAERGGEWRVELTELWFLVPWMEPFLLIGYFFWGTIWYFRYNCSGQQESDRVLNGFFGQVVGQVVKFFVKNWNDH